MKYFDEHSYICNFFEKLKIFFDLRYNENKIVKHQERKKPRNQDPIQNPSPTIEEQSSIQNRNRPRSENSVSAFVVPLRHGGKNPHQRLIYSTGRRGSRLPTVAPFHPLPPRPRLARNPVARGEGAPGRREDVAHYAARSPFIVHYRNERPEPLCVVAFRISRRSINNGHGKQGS